MTVEPSLSGLVASALITSMVHLDLEDDADWDEIEDRAVAALLAAGEPTEVITAMVRASMIIDQFLLEIACRPSEGRPRSAVISSAGRLVHDLVGPRTGGAAGPEQVQHLVRSYGVEVYSFGRFQVDPGRRVVRADGAVVDLAEAQWGLLLCLLINRDRIVGHDELRAAAGISPARPSGAVAAAVETLRRHLDDGSRRPMIRTASGRGYQFVAPVQLSRRTRDTDDHSG